MKILVAIDDMNFDINDGNASIQSNGNTMCISINSIEKNSYGECTTKLPNTKEIYNEDQL